MLTMWIQMRPCVFLALVILFSGPPGSDLLQGLWEPQPEGLGGFRAFRGTGLVQISAQVQQCHAKCKVCHLFDYDMTWHCIECQKGYELWVDGCFLPCPTRQYRYGYNCESCYRNCDQCVGTMAHECQVCSRGYKFDFRGLCMVECTPGKYPSVDGQVCNTCDSYCKTCIAGSRISCSFCYEGYTLRILDFNTNTGECMQDCKKGFFRDAPNDLRCIQCSSYCIDCNSLYDCFECEPGATLFRGICYLIPTSMVDQGIDFDT
ncbi:unnamed protein product, partial [Polarella glacialis]